VGFVFQDVRLLRMSVRDNIALPRPEAGLDEVTAVAKAAAIDDRIRALPGGYDTVEAALSGGEAQRVSIARALLADAPVLVLDEATAFADPESEAVIQEGLSRLASGRTVLVVAHRLSTVVDADQIVVLDGGVIAERGTHTELLERDGRYAAMWATWKGANA
jgi:ATP-binding cassette subfamily B protein